MENATTFSQKRVEELMVPIQDVFMLSEKQKLNRSVWASKKCCIL